ncbi:hypothetical protein [Streptomyces sp. NPDC057302]|uniref:hypothetical protein n=1 Tax=Streptomyces sp. NPDC057302 TaxID=3346094 RepID=UPI003643F908
MPSEYALPSGRLNLSVSPLGIRSRVTHGPDHSQNHPAEATLGEHFGARLDPGPGGELKMTDRARDKAAELTGLRPEAALLLLRDLREI